MKKLFSCKSGFTLVEIIVAFAVFAIMSTMILAVLRLSVQERAKNDQWADVVDQQTEVLARKDKDMTIYSDAAKDGDITITFDNGKDFTFPYTLGDTGVYDENGGDGLNYYVGNFNYASDGDFEVEDGEGSGEGSVLNRLDTRIFGSTEFEEIRVYDLHKDTSYSGTGVRYLLTVAALNSSDVKDETRSYRQFRMKFTEEILECGYVKKATYNGTPTCTRYNERIFTASDSENLYDVRPTSSNTLRFGMPFSYLSRDFDVSKFSYVYVVLEQEIAGLDENSFGDNGIDNGSYVAYRPYQTTTTDEDGNTITIDYCNVYGAYPKAVS